MKACSYGIHTLHSLIVVLSHVITMRLFILGSSPEPETQVPCPCASKAPPASTPKEPKETATKQSSTKQQPAKTSGTFSAEVTATVRASTNSPTTNVAVRKTSATSVRGTEVVKESTALSKRVTSPRLPSAKLPTKGGKTAPVASPGSGPASGQGPGLATLKPLERKELDKAESGTQGQKKNARLQVLLRSRLQKQCYFL